MKRFGSILWGLIFIVVGGIFALNALGITNIDIFFSGWWTLFIIIPSLIGIFRNSDKTGNIIFLIIGTLLLLACQDIITFSTIRKFILPIILVAIGLSIIFKNTISEQVNKKIRELNKDGLEEYYATFSGQKLNFKDEEFKGTNINAVFGGAEVDLREAIITEDKIIKASAIFGGIDIFTSQNYNVKVKSTSIFGGVDDKTVKNAEDNKPTIYIDAFCLFGGVEVK